MKHLLIFLLIQWSALSLSAQNTIYFYGSDYGEIASADDAKYRKDIFTYRPKVTRAITSVEVNNEWKRDKTESYRETKSGSYKIKSSSSRLFSKKTDRYYTLNEKGQFTFKDYMGEELIKEGTTTRKIPLLLQDTMKLYYPGGGIKSVAWYSDNKLIGNRNWLRNGTEYIEDIFYYVDEGPEHSMGPVFFRHYILDGLSKTELDLTQVSDLVVLGWVIRENGEIDGIHPVKGVFRELNTALVQLIKELPGAWVPAKLNGKPVNYYMEIPFNFTRREDGFESLELSGGFVIWD